MMLQQNPHGAKGRHRQVKLQTTTMQNWKEPGLRFRRMAKKNAVIDCGWGRLVFGQTFTDSNLILKHLMKERPGQRDLAFYVTDPHVICSMAPSDVFLDPSHTFRIWFENYRPTQTHPQLFIRRLRSKSDVERVNQILLSRQMVPLDPKSIEKSRNVRSVIHLVAEQVGSGEIVGFVCGVDHRKAFSDPEGGSSLWSLATDPNCGTPRIGEALTRYLIEYFMARELSFMDLSVIHRNHQAISLYKKLHFERVPVFCVKRKSSFNVPLFTRSLGQQLNPYAQILVNEAQRRGIKVDIIDKEMAYFRLTWGGQSVVCRESLTEYTSAIAMSRCSDKAITLRLLKKAGLKVPQQISFKCWDDSDSFLNKHGSVVVKPLHGEQGRGVKVDIRTHKALRQAIQDLSRENSEVLVEEFVSGLDVRIIVINYEFVAAAVRRPPEIVGDGRLTIKTLISKLSRRRSAATQGESKVPIDDETLRCIRNQKYDLDDVLPNGETLIVRKAANVHTGGSIADVTDEIHDDIKKAAVRAARALEIPVVGFDFIMPKVSGTKYHIIEANERPGLANHEPQPTAEKFIDFLFPLTKHHPEHESRADESVDR